jgi:hypothetical protein
LTLVREGDAAHLRREDCVIENNIHAKACHRLTSVPRKQFDCLLQWNLSFVKNKVKIERPLVPIVPCFGFLLILR